MKIRQIYSIIIIGLIAASTPVFAGKAKLTIKNIWDQAFSVGEARELFLSHPKHLRWSAKGQMNMADFWNNNLYGRLVSVKPEGRDGLKVSEYWIPPREKFRAPKSVSLVRDNDSSQLVLSRTYDSPKGDAKVLETFDEIEIGGTTYRGKSQEVTNIGPSETKATLSDKTITVSMSEYGNIKMHDSIDLSKRVVGKILSFDLVGNKLSVYAVNHNNGQIYEHGYDLIRHNTEPGRFTLNPRGHTPLFPDEVRSFQVQTKTLNSRVSASNKSAQRGLRVTR